MTEHNSATQDAQIRPVIDAWADAIRNKDASGVARHHAPGFVHFSLAPPLKSTPADTKDLEAWFDTWQGPIGYEFHDLHILASDDTAFSHGLVRLSGTKVDGKANEVWFRHTFGFRKTGGTWKIVHEHESVPFYMDGSFKAAVDLKR